MVRRPVSQPRRRLAARCDATRWSASPPMGGGRPPQHRELRQRHHRELGSLCVVDTFSGSNVGRFSLDVPARRGAGRHLRVPHAADDPQSGVVSSAPSTTTPGQAPGAARPPRGRPRLVMVPPGSGPVTVQPGPGLDTSVSVVADAATCSSALPPRAAATDRSARPRTVRPRAAPARSPCSSWWIRRRQRRHHAISVAFDTPVAGDTCLTAERCR